MVKEESRLDVLCSKGLLFDLVFGEFFFFFSFLLGKFLVTIG